MLEYTINGDISSCSTDIYQLLVPYQEAFVLSDESSLEDCSYVTKYASLFIKVQHRYTELGIHAESVDTG